MAERDRYLDAAPIFLAAVELPVDERLPWVKRVCSADEELLDEVLTLLDYDTWPTASTEGLADES